MPVKTKKTTTTLNSSHKMYLHQFNGQKPKILRKYDSKFSASKEYMSEMPDMMLAENAIQGSSVVIQQVGIANFKLPLNIKIDQKNSIITEARVTGTVGLASHLKGINMSRIMRSFYKFSKQKFDINSLSEILKSYKKDLNTDTARIKINFSFPLEVESLRSKLKGFQYYTAAFEAVINKKGEIDRFIELDFVYSSACPCSAELTEHAREVRGAYGIPHSQRSKARVKIKLAKSQNVSLVDLRNKFLVALKTETQVMVKREDEQAFAEMNGAFIKFVEDAARLVFAELDKDKRISDFEVFCSHLESLHSHDAISAICKGIDGGFTADYRDFEDLIC
jgi:GTP cyclohydrolase I